MYVICRLYDISYITLVLQVQVICKFAVLFFNFLSLKVHNLLLKEVARPVMIVFLKLFYSNCYR